MRHIKIEKTGSFYADYLKDESRLCGRAETIAFPESVEELRALMEDTAKQKIPVTFQGSRTGITGACVPQGGMIVCMEKMAEIGPFSDKGEDSGYLRVQAGARLCDIADRIGREGRGRLFFPPDPTEKTATIGGMFALNASGMNRIRYGKTADYIEEMTFITANGRLWEIRRGQYRFGPEGCPTPDGGILKTAESLRKPELPVPAGKDSMDLIDFLAGSEGMLGAAAEFVLRLELVPQEEWGVMFFFDREKECMAFLDGMEERWSSYGDVTAVEYYDERVLELIRLRRKQMSSLQKLPEIAPGKACAVYVQLAGEEEEAVEGILMELLENFEASGGREEDTWAGAGEGEMEKFRIFRHAVPEAVNGQVDEIRKDLPEFCKMGLDYAFCTIPWSGLIRRYREELEAAGIDGAVFGHIADRHLHVNLLPKNPEERKRACELADKMAAMAVGDGGCLADENGIGKIKKNLGRYLSKEAQEYAESVKKFMDPDGRLNPGSLF